MSDFAQAGPITTLQRLNDSHLATIEAELSSMAPAVGLILPCHENDLEQPAFARIVAELAPANWLRTIVLSMNGKDERTPARAAELVKHLPQRVQILWHPDASSSGGDAPRARLTGKGQNVAAALQALCAGDGIQVIAAQDCDVASFQRHDLARLCYAVAHPSLAYRFAKAYYSRATDRLHGRVTRLFLSPLLHACVRVLGYQPLLNFLLSFRYPLAGEVAMTRDFAQALPIGAGWSLEIATLCEVFRKLEPRDVCQVDGGRGYDHKHQPAQAVVTNIAREVGAELFRQLELEIPFQPDFRALIAAAYAREAHESIRRSAALARINALTFEEAEERNLVAAYSAELASIGAAC